MGAATILAVDEGDFELLITQCLRRQIRERKFARRFAHHARRRFAVLTSKPGIELMLLNINMPVMDGLILLAELRQRQSPVRVIIATSPISAPVLHSSFPARLRSPERIC